MKKKRIKIGNKNFILKIKKMILFDDAELFQKQDFTDIPDLTEEEIDEMVDELKNS